MLKENSGPDSDVEVTTSSPCYEEAQHSVHPPCALLKVGPGAGKGIRGKDWEEGELGAHCPSTLVHTAPALNVHKYLCAQTHFPFLHFPLPLFPPILSPLSPPPLIGHIPKDGVTCSKNRNMFKFFMAVLNCFLKMLYVYTLAMHERKSSWSIFCASFDRRKLEVQTVGAPNVHCLRSC